MTKQKLAEIIRDAVLNADWNFVDGERIFLHQSREACMAAADAVAKALGVTLDPELPPRPWRVDEAYNGLGHLAICANEEPVLHHVIRAKNPAGWAMLRAAVDAYNREGDR